jgi:hypothetical protein
MLQVSKILVVHRFGLFLVVFLIHSIFSSILWLVCQLCNSLDFQNYFAVYMYYSQCAVYIVVGPCAKGHFIHVGSLGPEFFSFFFFFFQC